MSERPVIIIGSPNDAHSIGDNAANGGVKSQNLWVNLLRTHGYDAFFCSYDGSQVQWLIEHAPVISIAQAKDIIANKPTRVMSTWLWSQALFDIAPRYYLYDQELAFTSEYRLQRGLLEEHLNKKRIIKVGTHTRTMQAWYNAVYGLLPDLITEWSADYWQPAPERRVANRIGYLNEGGHTNPTLLASAAVFAKQGLEVDWLECCGCESEVLAKMQTCDLFLGMNAGKSDQWGEGCPRSPHEAMLTGCVVVAFDVLGNGQYLHDPATGRLVPRGRPDLMAQRALELLRDVPAKEALRARSYAFMDAQYRGEARWSAVRDFLDLEDA